jgi:hypothetical protein
MNLSSFPLHGVPLSMSDHQIFEVESKRTQVGDINLM